MGKLLGTFFIFIILLILAKTILGLITSFYVGIMEFLFNTKFGILFLIAGSLSILFFYISSHAYLEARLAGKVMKVVKPILINLEKLFTNMKSNPKPMRKQENITEEVINLSRVDLQGVIRDLAIAINKGNPIIFKGWGNRRLEMDVQRVKILQNYIHEIRGLGEEFLNLQADALFSYQKLQHFIEMRETQAKYDMDLLNAQYQDTLDRYTKAKETREIMIRDLKSKVDREEALNKFIGVITENLENISPQVRDIALAIINPLSQRSNNVSGDDVDILMEELRRLEKEQDIKAKDIANLKADIERRNMWKKYKENWRNDEVV